jgi:hypothetical protein
MELKIRMFHGLMSDKKGHTGFAPDAGETRDMTGQRGYGRDLE